MGFAGKKAEQYKCSIADLWGSEEAKKVSDKKQYLAGAGSRSRGVKETGGGSGTSDGWRRSGSGLGGESWRGFLCLRYH